MFVNVYNCFLIDFDLTFYFNYSGGTMHAYLKSVWTCPAFKPSISILISCLPHAFLPNFKYSVVTPSSFAVFSALSFLKALSTSSLLILISLFKNSHSPPRSGCNPSASFLSHTEQTFIVLFPSRAHLFFSLSVHLTVPSTRLPAARPVCQKGHGYYRDRPFPDFQTKQYNQKNLPTSRIAFGILYRPWQVPKIIYGNQWKKKKTRLRLRVNHFIPFFIKKNYPLATDCHNIRSVLHNVCLSNVKKNSGIKWYEFSTSGAKCTLNRAKNVLAENFLLWSRVIRSKLIYPSNFLYIYIYI